MSDSIKRIELKDGRVRYRFVVDVGPDPGTGKRTQLTRTFDTLREAKAERARMISESARGTFVRPRKTTLSKYLDEWFEGATRNVRPATRRSYADALSPVHARLGARQLQDLTKADVESLVTWMATEGRKRGGKAGTGLGPRSIRLTLGRLVAALDMAQAEGLVVRNVAKLVTPPAYEPAERAGWSAEQVRDFKRSTLGTRCYALWLLAFLGLRRGELLGLRWDDVEFGDGQVRVSIERSRTLVAGVVTEGPLKTKGSRRVLPVTDPEIAAALRRLRALQAAERLAAGEAYEDGGGHIAVDELGWPVHPDWLSDEFERVRTRAGLPRIVLHGTRHTSATILDDEGVAEADNSMWHGHVASSASGRVSTTRKHYIHPDVERRLKLAGEVLAQAYRIETAADSGRSSRAAN